MRAQHSCCSRPTSTSKTPHTTRQTDKRHHSHLAVCKTICTLRVVRVSVRDPLLVNASLNASLSLSRKNLSQPPLSGPRGVCLSQRGKTRDQNVSRSSSRARARARALATADSPLRSAHFTHVCGTQRRRDRESGPHDRTRPGSISSIVARARVHGRSMEVCTAVGIEYRLLHTFVVYAFSVI